MSQVNGKYIKDENGNIISPITSAESVVFGGGEPISSYIPIELWSGNLTIPHSNDSNYITITTSLNIDNFERLEFTRSREVVSFANLTNSTSWINATQSAFQAQSAISTSTWSTELFNIFGFFFQVYNSTTIRIKWNRLAQIWADGSVTVNKNYTGMPLTKIVGYKKYAI